MTNEERNKKLAEARVRYGRPWVFERRLSKPIKEKKQVLAESKFSHQKKPFNV